MIQIIIIESTIIIEIFCTEWAYEFQGNYIYV